MPCHGAFGRGVASDAQGGANSRDQPDFESTEIIKSKKDERPFSARFIKEWPLADQGSIQRRQEAGGRQRPSFGRPRYRSRSTAAAGRIPHFKDFERT